MKKLLYIIVILCLGVITIQAQNHKKPSISQEEFRARQEVFITEKANLSKEEATKFFPVYFELQDKKKKINDRVWGYFKKGKDPKTTDAQYEEYTDNILNERIASDELDKSYFDKFKKILPPGKLFKVQYAEMKFHRELLKGMNKKNGEKKN